MQTEGAIFDCSCGLRYTRSVIDLDAIEHARAFCPCRALLGQWDGHLRLIFEPEDPLLPATAE